MSRPLLEVADIFHRFGEAWLQKNIGHLNKLQHQVMNAISRCRSTQLGGHVLTCQDCGHVQVAYNSCRNRHCPKCQGSAAKRWLNARMQDVLPVEYYHLVFTLPEGLRDLAYQNKSVVYSLLFQAVSQTIVTIGGDPKHLGAKVGGTLVLHTWGSTMIYHPHIHGIIAGGGLSADRQHWISCKKGFFLSNKVLSRLFRRLFLEKLQGAFKQLQFFNHLELLKDFRHFTLWLSQFRQYDWVVYAKQPFGGPEQVLAYLSRYTHRIAIANSRLLALKANQVYFKYKDYRAKGRSKHQTMHLSTDEFMRRFLLHVLPSGFHRIRHFGLLSNSQRKSNLIKARELLKVNMSDQSVKETDVFATENLPIDKQQPESYFCAVCGSMAIIVSTVEKLPPKRAPPVTDLRTSLC